MALLPGVTPAPHPITKPLPARGKTPIPKKRLAAAAAGGGNPGAVTTPVNPYQTQAQSEIDPIIAAITAAATGQASAADQAIQGLTNSYAQGISGIDYGSPYSGAEAQQAAVDAALQQSATGQGSDLAAALSQRLQALRGSSGAGAAQQEANALASQGSGIGGAELASGSAALNQLISDAAAAKSYGQKMPGVIDSAGLQGIEQSQGQAQQAINSGTLQAESQLPSIEQTLKADKLQAQANASENAYRAAEIAAKNATLGLTARKDAAQIAQGNSRLAIEQQNANTSAARLNLEAQKAADSSKQAWARIGISDKHLQIEAIKSSIAAKNGGLSATTVQEKTAEAQSWAQRMMGPTTDPNTLVKNANGQLVPKQLPQLSFKDAMTEALSHGVPLDIAFPQFIKVAKQSGATPEQIRQLQKEYKPLDAAIKIAAVRAAKSVPLFPSIKGVTPPFGVSGRVPQTPEAKTIVGLANEYLGTPYVWGGESPKGFDCSGFAQYLYGKAGISIPRTTYTQWTAPYGRPVPKGQLAPGDLVFFKGGDAVVQNGQTLPGHVGIYIGGGKMIDAPHAGSDVRVESVDSFGGYMGARRFGKG